MEGGNRGRGGVQPLIKHPSIVYKNVALCQNSSLNRFPATRRRSVRTWWLAVELVGVYVDAGAGDAARGDVCQTQKWGAPTRTPLRRSGHGRNESFPDPAAPGIYLGKIFPLFRIDRTFKG